MKLDTILVPLDGSTLAEAALPRAIELARAGGARLLLLRAAEAHTLIGVDPTAAQIQVVEDAEKYLAGVAERISTLGVRDIDTSVWYGAPATAILEATRLRQPDLIVMTTHGRSGLERLIFGSVAETVLRSTTTPILLIRPAGAPVETRGDEGRAVPWPAAEGRA
jgi:nucleotide-binding universal stress UspA family protein